MMPLKCKICDCLNDNQNNVELKVHKVIKTFSKRSLNPQRKTMIGACAIASCH